MKAHSYVKGVCSGCKKKEPASAGLSYRLIRGIEYTVSLGTCTDSEVIIPSYYNGLPVKSVEDFSNGKMTSIVIPNTVDGIG